MTCQFCKIVKHQRPDHIVYEDKDAMAFLSKEQKSKCHILVVPKKHFRNIYSLDEKTAAKIFKVTTRIAKAVKKSVKPDGLNIFQCNEKAADQSIFHFHIHIFPRFKGDGLFSIYNKKRPSYRGEQYLQGVQQKIAKAIKNSR